MFLFISKTFVVFGLVLCQRSCEVCSANISLIVRLSYRSVFENVRILTFFMFGNVRLSQFCVRSLSEKWIIFSSSVLDQKYATLMLVLPSFLLHTISNPLPYATHYYDFGLRPDLLGVLLFLCVLLVSILRVEWYTVING